MAELRSTFFGMADRPTAVLCYNDLTAIGLLAAAAQAGVPVPGALSVVGYDDIPMSACTVPPLTTVRQPKTAMGRAVACRQVCLRRRRRHRAAGPLFLREIAERPQPERSWSGAAPAACACAFGCANVASLRDSCPASSSPVRLTSANVCIQPASGCVPALAAIGRPKQIHQGDLEPMNSKVRVAIAGVGNCASSLIQGVHYYAEARPKTMCRA